MLIETVSYDVMKDEIPVATLTFAKGAYRLGETLLGVLEVNEPTVMGGKVLKVCRQDPEI